MVSPHTADAANSTKSKPYSQSSTADLIEMLFKSSCCVGLSSNSQKRTHLDIAPELVGDALKVHRRRRDDHFRGRGDVGPVQDAHKLIHLEQRQEQRFNSTTRLGTMILVPFWVKMQKRAADDWRLGMRSTAATATVISVSMP